MSTVRTVCAVLSAFCGLTGCQYTVVPDAPKATEIASAVKVAAIPVKPVEPALPLGYSWDVPESMQGVKIRNQGKGIQKKIVALTFDDGPSANITPQVLGTLSANNVKATFFLMGLHMKTRPELVKEIVSKGHAIGGHTYTHARKPDEYVAEEEIKRWDALFHDITRRTTRLFRPPFGNLRSAYSKAALKAGYPLILWTNTGADTARHINAEKVYTAVMEQLHPGDIILLHDSQDKQHTATALPHIIKTLKEKGYTFVTVPEMLKEWDAFQGQGRSKVSEPPLKSTTHTKAEKIEKTGVVKEKEGATAR
ncbi:hypothetical protein LBMAG21_03430 [Armatimonadota bacterium]|nr:hypothetical protein LBMAG21_03430 [Armatimonadota bacterium]